MDILQWARQNACPWDWMVYTNAVTENHLEFLEYAHANQCPWNSRVCNHAAWNGHLHILEWAFQHGLPMDLDSCLFSARIARQQDVVEWILKHHTESEPGST